jgi:hypothetical protein
MLIYRSSPQHTAQTRKKSHHITPLSFPPAATIPSLRKIMIRETIDKQVLELKKLWANKRMLTFQLLNLAMIVFSALMIWKGLMFVTKVSLVGV